MAASAALDYRPPDDVLYDSVEMLFATAATGVRGPSGQPRFVTQDKKNPSSRVLRDQLGLNATSYTHWRRANWPEHGLGSQISFTERLINIVNGQHRPDDPARGLSDQDAKDVYGFWRQRYDEERKAVSLALGEYLDDLRSCKADIDAQRDEAELKSAMRALGERSRTRPRTLNAPIAVLKPGEAALGMLRHYPPDLAEKWKHRTIDGAIEIVNSPRGRNLYGGYRLEQIACDLHDREWPDDFGALSDDIAAKLAVGLVGDGIGDIKGWLQQKSTPGRIRLLCAPLSPPVLDRPELSISLGCSDYFAVRTITELSRLNLAGAGPRLHEMFPLRWIPGLSGADFDTQYIPYHVSAQAVVLCRTDNKLYLLLGSVNTAHASMTSGWGATIAEQMWAPDRARLDEPWWARFVTNRLTIVRQPETRAGDEHIRDTLSRGLREELGLVLGQDTIQEPLFLNAAIEEDMYFITFIFMVLVDLGLDEIHHRWSHAPDHHELGLLAAYQLTGANVAGSAFDGPRRLAELLSRDIFDAGPHLLPGGCEPGRVRGPWHCSSRLRMYAAGMHLWPEEFPKYARIVA